MTTAATNHRRRVRELAAELEVLDLYDALRSGWFDYGGGQRAAELSRRRRELDAAADTALHFDRDSAATSRFEYLDELDVAGDPTELLAAFERVARPRMRRLERESYRHGTKATNRSVATWRRTLTILEERALRARTIIEQRARANVYCTCGEPVIDVEHDAGCRRCGRPVDFSPLLRSAS